MDAVAADQFSAPVEKLERAVGRQSGHAGRTVADIIDVVGALPGVTHVASNREEFRMPGVSTTEWEAFRVLTLENGESNLLNPDNMSSMLAALREADGDDDVAGIVITGRGTSFCGGLDVGALRAGADPVEFARALVALLQVFPVLCTPVVAAVNGDALASGVSLVCACDFAAAVPAARIGTYEVSVGIWPMIAQVPLIQRIGARAAMENVGSGEPFSADRARELGIVQRIVESDPVGATLEWLTDARRAGAAAAAGRPSVYELAQLPYREALDAALDKFVAQFADAD